jgi:hypothetical protein
MITGSNHFGFAVTYRPRLTQFPKLIYATVVLKVRRVAPADFSTGALARSVRGRFDHTAPPLIRLMEIPRCLHTPLAWETGNPSTDQGTVSSSALLVDFGG